MNVAGNESRKGDTETPTHLALDAQALRDRETGIYGQKLDLITMQCVTCKKYALRVDQDDVDRHYGGVYVQHVFVRRNGAAYLTPAERELFLSRCCRSCWAVLCPSSPLAYS